VKHRHGMAFAWLIFWLPWAAMTGWLVARLLVAIHG
jgi:hypothetical protein